MDGGAAHDDVSEGEPVRPQRFGFDNALVVIHTPELARRGRREHLVPNSDFLPEPEFQRRLAERLARGEITQADIAWLEEV